MAKIYYDIVIVGGGATGLRAALEIAKSRDISCAIISKVHPLRSQTCMAQGGMNAALGNNKDQGEDSIEEHIKDTIEGSEYLCDQDAVEFFCEEAPKCLIELEHMGMIFSRSKNGKIAQRPFGGGMFPRTCFSRDFTGHMMLSTLYTESLRHDIPIHTEWYFHSLIVEDNILKGIVVIDMHTSEVIEISSKAVIVATGGGCNIFKNTVNSTTSTGDGVAVCYRSGVPLKDIEFIQFHPTSLGNKGILITEGTRGEGAHLRNSHMERFMSSYDAKFKELASRDVVAQAIQCEIDAGRDINGNVLLDLTHLGEKLIKERLPQVYGLVKDFAGINCIKEPIPVRPAAHYFIGGIDTDKECQTNIKGLYAAGECSCISIHGANRLGGNSLMETIVFGKKAGQNALKYAENTTKNNIKNSQKEEINENIEDILKRHKGVPYTEIREKLNETVDKNAGIFRSHKSLIEGTYEIKNLKDKYKEVTINNPDKSLNLALFETLELNNLLDISDAVFITALKRKESRGAHYRKDFTNRDDYDFLKHSLTYYNSEGNPKVDYKDVTITNYQPKPKHEPENPI